MTKAISVILMVVMVVSVTKSQDLTGTWVGAGGGTAVPIVLVKNGDHYVGHTHDRDGFGFCKTNFVAEYDSATKKFEGKSAGFIGHTFFAFPNKLPPKLLSGWQCGNFKRKGEPKVCSG